MAYYSKLKKEPLTSKEIKQKAKEIRKELKEVYEWEKEINQIIEDKNASPQKKAAAKRSLKKAQRRINTVKGQIIYWDLRAQGQSHFRAQMEMNDFWEECEKEKI